MNAPNRLGQHRTRGHSAELRAGCSLGREHALVDALDGRPASAAWVATAYTAGYGL